MCPLVFDLVVFVLTLYKSISSWRNGARTNLIAVIARDSIVFYALAVIANCSNIINFALTPPTDNRILLCSFACAIQGIAVSPIAID